MLPDQVTVVPPVEELMNEPTLLGPEPVTLSWLLMVPELVRLTSNSAPLSTVTLAGLAELPRALAFSISSVAPPDTVIDPVKLVLLPDRISVPPPVTSNAAPVESLSAPLIVKVEPEPRVITGAEFCRKTLELMMVLETAFCKLMLLVLVSVRMLDEGDGVMEKLELLNVRLLKVSPLSLSVVAVRVVPLKFRDTPVVRDVPPQLAESFQLESVAEPPVQETEGDSRGSNSSTMSRDRRRDGLFFRLIVPTRERKSDLSQPFQVKPSINSNSSSRRWTSSAMRPLCLLLPALTRPKSKQFLNQLNGLKENIANLKNLGELFQIRTIEVSPF